MLSWLSLPTCFLVLATIAVSISAWLTGKSFSGASLPGCGAGSGCDAVLASRWSRWGAIHVSAPATLLYLFVLVAYGAAHPAIGWRPPVIFCAASAGAVLLAGAAAIWFLVLQIFAMRRICIYCTTIHVCAVGMALLVLLGETAPVSLPHDFASRLLLVGIPAVGTAVLVGGQLVLEPKLYSLKPTDRKNEHEPSDSPGKSIDIGDRPSASSPYPPGRRTIGRLISLLDGAVQLNASEWPMLGSAVAPHILVYLFDYTCPTCRKTHGLLLQAAAEFGPELSILMAPAPVDPSCNPHIQKQTAMHAQACRYARLGLLVWSLDPDKYERFDHWFFSQDELPPLGIAVRHAEELLSTHGLDPSMPDPAIDRFITKGVAMYKAAGGANMPILLFPHAILTGLVPSPERLRDILEEQFGFPHDIADRADRLHK